jgi:hypothetical protein
MARLGLITGLPLPEHSGRGRPREYINADARMLHVRLGQVERLIDKLAREVGFTPEAEKMLRARLFQVGNALNRNVLRARRKNPVTHSLLLLDRDGRCVAVCGVVTPEEHMTESAALVTCQSCRGAL